MNMKYVHILSILLTLNGSISHAETDATYDGNVLHIPHAVYKGEMYDVEMTLKTSNQLRLKKAQPITGSELTSPGVKISDDLKFTLTSIVSGNQKYRADIASEEEGSFIFNISGLTLIKTDAIFSDSLNVAYYNLSNPLTGNDQLAVYDAKNNQHTVVKTDVILGKRNFVFGGKQEGDKVVYQSRKYGIFLDPTKENEPRTAPNGSGGQFEYNFYCNYSA